MAKRLHKKGLVYFEDNINLNVELNYQLIANIVEDVDSLVMNMKSIRMIKTNCYIN